MKLTLDKIKVGIIGLEYVGLALAVEFGKGEYPALPKIGGNIGNRLSPYAVTKYVNEFVYTYGVKS